jgi:ankyrin repeat protein
MKPTLSILFLMVAVIGCKKIATPDDLCAAVMSRDADAVSQLLAEGANANRPNRKGDRPISLASEKPNNAAVFRLLLEHGAELNPLGYPSPLVYADETMVPLLLASGANVNTCSPGNKEPPLQYWVETSNKPGVVGLLLSHGADPKIATRPLVLKQAYSLIA